MGFFSGLFKSKSKNVDWDVVSTDISNGLLTVRNSWYEECVKTINASTAKLTIPKEASKHIKAYQLIYVIKIIQARNYISEKHGRDFADVLWLKVCGEDMKECVEIAQKYYSYSNDIGKQVSIFAMDTYSFITGKSRDIFGSLTVAPTVPKFTAFTQAVVASAFDDKALYQKLTG